LADGAAAPHGNGVAWLDVAVFSGHVSRRKDVGKEQDLFVRKPVLDLERAHVGEGHARVFGLTAGEAAGQVRVSEDSRRRVAEHLLGQPGVWVRVLAERIHLPLAEEAGAAGNRKADHHAITDLQLLDFRPDLDDFSHELVANDVAPFHRRNIAVVEVQVGAADSR
jgi:hypothetical protein